MNKYCEVCNKETNFENEECLECRGASVTVPFICEKMGVVRQAVYAKADRKNFGKRYKKPVSGGKNIRVFTEDEANILISEDLRYKEKNNA